MAQYELGSGRAQCCVSGRGRCVSGSACRAVCVAWRELVLTSEPCVEEEKEAV